MQKAPEIVRAAAESFRGIDNLTVLNGAEGMTGMAGEVMKLGLGVMPLMRQALHGNGKPEDSDLQDESVTFLDRETFHLRGGYLVVRGRTLGRGTMSGWALSHGGLLPE